MGNRNSSQEPGERAAESARGVALDYDQVGGRAQQCQHRGRNHLDVPVRIDVARAAKLHRRIGLDPKIRRIETGVLPCNHQRRRQAAIAERMRYRG
jgi:hypothetical protein